MKGKVKWFDAKKGYGFIVAESGSDVFVHYSNIAQEGGFRTLNENEEVEFTLEKTDRGEKALDVKKLSAAKL